VKEGDCSAKAKKKRWVLGPDDYLTLPSGKRLGIVARLTSANVARLCRGFKAEGFDLKTK
jgi:hypothetical protein